MFAKMRSPVSLTAAELDSYLARGWFRMRQNIFTTHFLQFDGSFYSVLWLRVALKDLAESKKHKTLRSLNTRFRSEIKEALITERHEILYQAYQQSISFDVSASLKELLLGTELYNMYDTYQINLYDGERLIATGFFDIGKTSAAGISCIYHPAYKKYSLGKYLIYLKMDFCRNQAIQYFYPGYLVPGYKAFDYKAEIGTEKLEYFDLASQQWLPFGSFTPGLNPLQCMVNRLGELKTFLEIQGIASSLLYYKFFDANLDPGFYGHDLFDFPVFLYCFPTMGSFDYHLVVYDVRDDQFHLLQCSSVIHLDYYTSVENVFSSGLLKVDRFLFSSPDPLAITTTVSTYL